MSMGGLTEALEKHENEKFESVRDQCKTAFKGICDEMRKLSSSMPGVGPEPVDAFEGTFQVPIERFLSKEYPNRQKADEEANLVMSLIREPFTEIRDTLIEAHSHSKAAEKLKQDADIRHPQVGRRAQVEARAEARVIDDLDGVLPTIRTEVLNPYVEMFK